MVRGNLSAFNELEPAAMGAIVAVETLMDEARGVAFGKPTIKVTGTPVLSNAAETVEIDRDRDGAADGSVRVQSLMGRALDKLDIDSDGDGRTDFSVKGETSFIWSLERMTVDKDNDGKIDMTMKVNRDWLLRIKSLEVDTQNDGKVDAIIRMNYEVGAPGLKQIVVDRSMSGLANLYFNVKRDSRYQPTLE